MGLPPSNTASESTPVTAEQSSPPASSRFRLADRLTRKFDVRSIALIELFLQGLKYRLERKAAMTDSTWNRIPGVNDLTAGSSGPAQITDPGAISLGKAFYQVRWIQ